MKRLLAALLGAMLALPARADLRVVDDAGRALRLERPPERIVSLAPHLTELLFAVGAGGQLVGTDTASDYPPAARKLPRVGDAGRINLERVIAARPDLVVIWRGGNRPADVRQLERLGLPLLVTDVQQLEDVSRLLRLLGQVSGHEAGGEDAARAFDDRLGALRRDWRRSATPVGVFYQLWDRPLLTVGGGHWISEAVALCGGNNVFADLGEAAPVVSREAVLLRVPQAIVGGELSAMRSIWGDFRALPAVRNRAFVEVDADLLHRPTPRLLDGVQQLCEGLAPYVR